MDTHKLVLVAIGLFGQSPRMVIPPEAFCHKNDGVHGYLSYQQLLEENDSGLRCVYNLWHERPDYFNDRIRVCKIELQQMIVFFLQARKDHLLTVLQYYEKVSLLKELLWY